MSGEINLLDYDRNEDKLWPVHSDCESVRMRSTKFETEEYYDFAIIGTNLYSGTIQIDTILPTNFTVEFYSDAWGTGGGFMLYWSCTQWGEWERLYNGNCGYVMRPLHNGTMTDGILKYKTSETCSKYSIYVHNA